MRRKNTFLHQVFLILIIYASCVRNQETRFTVDELTTSTAIISLSNEEENLIELHDDFGGDIHGAEQLDSGRWGFENLPDAHRYEVFSNSSPLNISILTATCPFDWTGFRHSCYIRVEDKKTRNAAQEYCNQSLPGAHLADPRTAEEFRFITSQDILQKKLGFNWIGITLDGKNMTYTDGSKVTEEIKGFQEDQSNARENCASISPYNASLWKDAQCEIQGYFICQYTGPQRPKNITIETASTFADVKWENAIQRYGYQLSYYNLFIFKKDNGIQDVGKSFPNVTKYKFDGLQPGHFYFMYIFAVHEYLEKLSQNSGAYSVQFTTNPEGPPNLKVVRKEFTEIEVEWEEFESENNVYDRFCVSNGEEMIYIDSDTYRATMKNLTPYTEYNITVYTVVEYYGFEKFSIPTQNATVSVTTDVSPVFDLHVVEDTLRETKFTIAWTPAEGLVDSYEVRVSRYDEDDSDVKKSYPVDSDQEMFDVDGLTSGENYLVSVVTKRLDGESSEVSLQQRPRPQPINRAYVMIDGVTVDSLDFTIYDFPGINNSVFDKYILEFEKPNGEIRNVFLQRKNGRTNDTVQNLTPGTSYVLKIYAESHGIRSIPVKFGDVSMELSPPENFGFLFRNETSIKLGWESSKGDLSRYLVTCEGLIKCPDEAKLVETDKENWVYFLNLKPGAEYTFTITSQITNKKNEQKTSKQVVTKVRTMPNNPGSVVVEYLDDNTVSLHWGNVLGSVSHFQVDYRASNDQNSTVPPRNATVFPETNSMATIANLTNGITYIASVYAVSNDTFSKPSFVEIQLKPNPVAKIEILEVGETWCNIGWKPGYGGYKLFEIEITLSNGQSVLTHTTSGLTYNATLPTPASPYNIRMFTISLSNRSSNASDAFAITRPLAVTDVEIYDVYETSFQVRWNPPKSSYDSFIILLNPKSKSEQRHSNTTKLSYEEFTNLMPGTFYTVKIFSVYNKTKSYHVTENVTLYPEAPDNLTTTASSTSLTISWEKPRGQALSYIVEWEPGHGENLVDGETAYLTGLTPGLPYKIDVYSNSAGNLKTSRTSSRIFVNTEESLPGTPTVLSKISPDITSFRVSWSETPNPNGIILEYTIKYKQIYPHFENYFRQKHVSAKEQEATVQNLESGSWYEFYLNAANSKGAGNWTRREYVRIKFSKPGSVTGLVALAPASYTLLISWEVPSRPNGDIIKYTLSVRDSKSEEIEFITFHRNESVSHFECFEGDHDLLHELRQEPELIDNTTILEPSFEGLCPVSYNLSGLKPHENYQVKVVAHTSLGPGTMAIINKTTKEEIPSGPPKNVTVQKVGPTSLILEWNPPESPNGRLFYTVSFAKIGFEITETRTNSTTYTVSDLRPFSIYAVALTSGTVAGNSKSTDWIPLNTTEDEPGQPLNLTGEVRTSKSVYLNWQPPNDTRGVVTEYQVSIYVDDAGKKRLIKVDKVKPENINATVLPKFMSSNTAQNLLIPINIANPVSYYLNSTNQKRAQPQIGSNKTVHHIVQQLQPYTSYEFQVRAVTSAGPGDAATTVLKTAEDKPGSRPTNLRYVNLTSTSVNLTWSEPENPNGKIIAYDVIYLSDEKQLSHEVLDTTYAVLEDLKKYSSYSVYVNSKTSAGRGNASDVLIMHTGEDAPDSPPRNLRYLNVTPAVVELSWDEPEIPNGVIQFYNVYYKNTTSDYYQRSTTTSVYLENLKIYGEYWVQVSGNTKYGDGGQLSEILYIKTGEGEPGTPPYNLKYENLNSTSIHLIWEKPLEPNGLILKYEITLENDNKNTSFVTPDDKTEYVIRGLKPYSAYTAHVRAHIKHGDGGLLSDPLMIQTLEDAPATSPTNVEYQNVSSAEIELSWQRPTVPNGVIVFYTIYINNKSVTVFEPNKSAIIDGLDPYTKYEIQLSSSTKAGESPNASLTIHTDEGKPSSPPRDVTYTQISSTAMSLAWLPPVKTNGIILSYELQYENDEKKLRATTNETKITLSNLDKYSRYSGKIIASTRVGYGPEYLPIEFQTLQDAPSDPPYNVTATAESTEIVVSWKPPKKPNGIIQFYTIYVSRANFPESKFKVVNSTTWTLTNLQQYTFYDIYVTGSTALGDGDQRSSMVRVKTKEGVPGTPVNDMMVNAVNSTDLFVNWSAPVPATGLFEYVVTVFETEAPKRLVYNKTHINAYAFIGSLEAFTNYTVKIESKVKNVIGLGPSSSIFTRTAQDAPSEPVQNLTAKNITSDSVTLTWDSSAKRNGFITNHYIEVIDSNIFLNTTEFNRAIIRGLRPNSYYEAVVVPATIVGSGPPAQIKFKTAEGIPEDSPTSLQIVDLTSDSAILTWDPPLKPNGQITAYKLIYHVINDKNETIGNTEESVVLQSPKIKHTLIYLEAYTRYSVVIYSGTSTGFGIMHSDPLYFTTLEGVPNAPVPECTAMDYETIMLSWDTPRKPNGIIISYNIGHRIASSQSNIISDSVDRNESIYLATDLLPYTSYTFTISAFTKVGEGEQAQCTVRTHEGYAEAPNKLRVLKSDSTSLTLQWLDPAKLNGDLSHYELFYQPPFSCYKNGNAVRDNDGQIKWCKVKSNGSKKTLTHLDNYSVYNISVAAVNGAGVGQRSTVHRFKTKVGAPPFPPRNVKATALSSTSIHVAWTAPYKLGGPTTYQVIVKDKIDLVTKSEILASTVQDVNIGNLDEDVRYNITVLAITSAGALSSEMVHVRTDEDAPGDHPAELRVKTIPGNSSSVILEFLPPTDPNGAIYEYNIQYKLKDNNDSTTINVLDEDLPYTGEELINHWVVVTGLLGGRSYYFRMNAATQADFGVGPYSPWVGPIDTPITAPPKTNVSVEITAPDPDSTAGQTVLNVDICVFSDVNGPLARIMVIVAEDGADLNHTPLQWLDAHILNPVPPYMVTATKTPSDFCGFDNFLRRKRSVDDSTFAVGQDDTCAETRKPYCNGPLKSNTPYRFKIRGETPDGNATETEFSDPVRTLPSFLEKNLYLIVGCAIGIFVFVLFVSILVIVLRRKYGHQLLDESQRSELNQNKRSTATDSSMPTSANNMSFVLEPTNKPGNKSITRPVERSHFVDHVSRMSNHKDKGFISEFEEIESVTPYGPKTIGSLPCNSNKNRFAEIIPYDLYRVKIESKSTEDSGYINASYIPGLESQEQYIATQSPLANTKNDFWKMMWETGAQKIVMLCNTDQNGEDHCTKYWPSLSQTIYFGNLAVQSLEDDRMPEWTVRKFHIAKRDKRRQITQYHFTMWPVRSVPDNPQPLVRFLRTVRADKTQKNNPTVVMCSSGSGRTAVFIALDSIVDGLSREANIDACGVVADLRNCRPNMIQTATEYSFLHRCLAFILLNKSTSRSSVRSPTGDGVEETTMF